MSVDSDFRMTVIEAQDLRPSWQGANERPLPHMAETIVILQSARAELVKATPNKGGHRERALGLIDQAIGEVQAGMNFAAGQ
jgi:hypothetical protein